MPPSSKVTVLRLPAATNSPSTETALSSGASEAQVSNPPKPSPTVTTLATASRLSEGTGHADWPKSTSAYVLILFVPALISVAVRVDRFRFALVMPDAGPPSTTCVSAVTKSVDGGPSATMTKRATVESRQYHATTGRFAVASAARGRSS